MKKVLMVSSGLFLGLMLLVGGLTAANWDRIQEVVERGKETMAEMSVVQSAVMRAYPTASVAVGFVYGTGGNELNIEMVNAEDAEGREPNAFAREVAGVAFMALNRPEEFDVINVELVNGLSTALVSITKSVSYSFTIAELADEAKSQPVEAEPQAVL